MTEVKITFTPKEEHQFNKAKGMTNCKTNTEFIRRSIEYYTNHLLSETVSRSTTSPNPNQTAQSLLDTAEKTLEQETEDDEQWLKYIF